MKFSCPKCNTRYNVSEDKVPLDKVVRFACKKCGNVIRLKRKDPTGPVPVERAPAAASPSSAFSEGSTRVASLAEINKLKHSSQQTSPGGEPERAAEKPAKAKAKAAEPASGQNVTRVASLREINKLKQSSQDAGPTPFDDTVEWYAMIGGKQHGPHSVEELSALAGQGRIDGRTYVWRDGLGDWQRLSAVKDLADHIHLPAPAAAAPPVAPATGGKRKADPAAKPRSTENQTVAMDARKLHEQLAKIRDDAADETDERSAAAIDASDRETNPFQNETAEIDARKLREQLDKSTAAEVDPDAETPFEESQKQTQSMAKAKTKVHKRSTETAPNADGAEIIAALTGEPSGPALKRGRSGEPDFASSTEKHKVPPVLLTQKKDNFEDIASAAQLGGAFDDDDGPMGPPKMMNAEDSAAYLQAPPGESTRVFMQTAGLFKRRRRNKMAAVIASIAGALLVLIVVGDATGLYTLPAIGRVYAVAGIDDPNVGRAIETVSSQLESADLSPEDRAKLEARLAGLNKKQEVKAPSGGPKPDRPEGAGKPSGPVETQGIKEAPTLAKTDKDLAASIFADTRKQESKINLQPPTQVQTPNLPEGLTQEAIIKVIGDNQRSMGLCIAEALKKGEKLDGKMDVEITIGATGDVTSVVIATEKFARTSMASCATRTMKRWKFPRFNGEPVPVEFPFVLSAGF